MKAKLAFVIFFVVTLLAIPAHSQGLLKRIKPWLYPDDSLDALGAKRMQPPELPFGGEDFGEKRASILTNFSSQLTDTQSFSDSVQALWVSHYASGLVSVDDIATATGVDESGNIYVTGYSEGSGTSNDYATVKYNASGVEQWVARYNGPGNSDDSATALAIDAAGNVYVTGNSRGSGTSYEYATVKYNTSGVEQWVARYNGPGNSDDSATALAIDAAGNVYVTGNSRGSATSYEYATVKYNTSGVEQWVARYNGPGNSVDRATALAVDAAGNVYVTGNSVGSGISNDYATVKYNASGVEQWVARYTGPGNLATALAVDTAGNVYVAGYSRSGTSLYDYATVKYNASGVEQWVARYNGPGNSDDSATALAVDAAGNVYVTGYSGGASTSSDYATVKYNASGVEQWVARYSYTGPGNSADSATALAVDAAGNVYVTGNSLSSVTFDDYATVKYNASGVEQWVARYNGPGNSDDSATALAVDAAGNVYVTGYSFGSVTSSDYVTVKYNASGVEQWVARYNGPRSSVDRATALAVDAAGNVYVAGNSLGSGTSSDYATVKYNASGVEQWVARYNGPGNSADSATALAVDAAGNVYVTGYSLGSGTFDDYATVKYNASGVEQWVARYNGPRNSDDRATALAVDAAGNVYVTGYSGSAGTSYDYATVKYNTSGVEQWVARYNGPGTSDASATALAVDAAGNVYVTGYSGGDYATVKYNASGVEQWVARYNGPGNSADRATALAVDAAGNVYVTGYSVGLVPSYDYATVKYNASGVEQWVARYTGPGNSVDIATALVVDAARNVYVAGSSSNRSNDQSIYTTIKYLQARTITTNSATNVGATFATLNATVNPDGRSTTVKFQYGTTANYGTEVVASPNPVIGTNPVSVSAKVIGLIPDTLYHFLVVATNNEGTTFGDDQTFTTLPCGPLTLVHTPVSFHDAGSSITATAKISGGACGLDSVILQYRRGGEKSFSTAIVSVDSLYRWTIPASAVTSRGVEYYIAATDTFNAVRTRMPAVGNIFSVQINDPSDSKKGEAQPNGSEQTAYRLISVPLDLDDRSAKAVLEDNFGPYNKKKWRLFALRPDNQAYVEFSDTLKMNPGRAFMLIVKEAGKFIDTGAGKSNPTDRLFSIFLQPQWNFFGNPFNFPIPLENLSLKRGKVFALRFHEETWRDPIIRKVTEIHPFEGYAIFNPSDVADTLLINPDLSSPANPLAKEFASTSEGKIQWSIRILAQCQEARDEDNVAGVVANISNNWDEMNYPEPPTIGEYVSVSFPHPEWGKLSENYCIDFRPESSEGHVWPLAVATNIRDKVHLTFEGLESVPEENEIWLIDEVVPVAQNLRQNKNYIVAAASPEHPRRLKLVVGKRDFVEEKIDDTQVIPTTYELNQNFPNPFNPATTIRYGLPQAERVTLKIYNLLGEEVALIMNDELRVAGYHVAIWDGRNKLGEVVGSGVYIYRFRAGNFVSIKKMALVK